MSHFNFGGTTFSLPPTFLVPTFHGALFPFLLESFSEDRGSVENLLEIPDSLSRRYTNGLVNRYLGEQVLLDELK